MAKDPCATCGGTGTVHCTHCGGSGINQNSGLLNAECYGCKGTGNDTCQACHGTGEWHSIARAASNRP